MVRTGYVYTLSCPNSGEVRYVGQTIDVEKRYSLHLWHSRNGRARTHKEKWLNTLINAGLKPVINTIWEGDATELDNKEIEYIAMYKALGYNLTNATIGGLTTTGRVCSEETKKKLSESMTGRKRWWATTPKMIQLLKDRAGWKMSDEQKAHLSRIAKGRTGYWRDHQMPQHVTNKLVLAGKAKSRKVISIKDGIEVEHTSLLAASIATGCERRTLSLVAEGKYKQCKGYVFKFA